MYLTLGFRVTECNDDRRRIRMKTWLLYQRFSKGVAMQTKRINPWPTPQQELQRLARTVDSLVCGTLLWETLTDGQQQRLGRDVATAFAAYGTVGMYRKLCGMPPNQAVLDVAKRINLLDGRGYERLTARVGEGGTTLNARARYAANAHALVLVPERRMFYFDGIGVDLSSRPKEWKLVELLAEKAPQRRLVDAEEVSEDVQQNHYLSKMLSRMSNRSGFPLGFCELIRSPNRDGRLYLELDADQICVISSNL